MSIKGSKQRRVSFSITFSLISFSHYLCFVKESETSTSQIGLTKDSILYDYSICKIPCIKVVSLQFVKYMFLSLSVDSIAIQVLEEKIKTESIPDISGDADTPVGHVSYSLSKYVYVAGQLLFSDVHSRILPCPRCDILPMHKLCTRAMLIFFLAYTEKLFIFLISVIFFT